jgi:hypothetical protein
MLLMLVPPYVVSDLCKENWAPESDVEPTTHSKEAMKTTEVPVLVNKNRATRKVPCNPLVMRSNGAPLARYTVR